MAGFFTALFLFFVAPAASVGAEELFQRDARITDAAGQFTLKTADQSKQVLSIDEETPLVAGDLLETGPQSRAEVSIEGEMVFELQAASRLKIKSLSADNTQIELLQGIVLAKVKPMTAPGQCLTVKMPTAVAAVRGTEFAAETGNSLSHVGVFDEGHVDVSGAWGREHVTLAPHQETKVTLSAVPQTPHKLNHFLKYRSRMPHVRNRAAYWRKNWTPLGAWQRQRARERLRDPRRPKSQGFRRAYGTNGRSTRLVRATARSGMRQRPGRISSNRRRATKDDRSDSHS